MADNTTESPVQADINDVLDNMAARNATLTRELAISQAQATARGATISVACSPRSTIPAHPSK